MFFQKIKKLTIGFILSMFIFSSLAGFIISAKPVNAQAVVVTGDIPAQAKGIWEMVQNGWKIAVLNAAQQAVSYFLRKVAYDSAVWLASGGKGQSGFTQTKPGETYFSSVASDAAGTAIEQLGKGFGLDLCKIPDVKIDIAFRIGLQYNYATDGAGPAKPACNLATFQENWSGEAWKSKYGDGNGDFDVAKVFNASLGVDDAPLGIVLNTTEKIDRLVARQVHGAEADRSEGGGFTALTDLISGEILTPSQVIKKEAEANTPSEQNKKSEAQIGAAMGSGAWEILPSTLSLFLNTLSGQMLKNFKENGMLPGGLCVGGYGGAACKNNAGSQAQNFDAGTSVSGRSIAEAAFSGFLVAKLDSASDYDLIPELNSCDSQGLYNCRVDDDMKSALQEAAYDKPVTIREAMIKGWLHPNAKLLSSRRTVDDSDKTCYKDTQRYCYSNIAVLRQLRIMPLGLQIAADKSNPDSPWTLKQVVDGFYDCEYNANGSVNYNPVKFPFCHLVDPNWVIKLPQTRCDALSYGVTPLSSGVPDRVKECLDLKSCVGKDANGNCAGYGNCVREKNVWKFDAKECSSPQYATCRAFTNSTGNSVAYLYRTLDTGECNQKTAGCTAYSLEQNDAGQWKTVAPTDYGNYSTGIYLNKNVSTACSANSAGCSAFKLADVTATNNPISFKKAPDYLHCYDSNASLTDGVQWPQTFSDIFKMQPRPECKNFAQVCIADEVGCSIYRLADTTEVSDIPGKFTPATKDADGKLKNWNDQCNIKCAGYAAYREMPSTYSSGTPLAYIIPPSKYNDKQSGTTCFKNELNCSSFTNMAAADVGGERVDYFTDLRTCIKPDINKQKNFYTYEGSVAAGGYQLQSYTLEKNPDGSPKTIFATPEAKATAGILCNPEKYRDVQSDPGCRQFNDDKGVIYYAMLANTVVVSADCTPYRLNSTELAGPEQCFGNGEYKDGACYYNGLPPDVKAYTQNSIGCTAAAVSCREYKGNNGNNIDTVVPTETFTNQADVTIANGWSAANGTISWSTESTHAGEHSLGYSGAANSVVKKTVILEYNSLDLQSDMSYNLSFWAKGNGGNVDISMTNEGGVPVTAGTITANTSWQYFTFNLMELKSYGTSTINFQLKSAGNLFLDNVNLTKVSAYLYLVKDSLKVDQICDDNQTDNLPGVALGCSAYSGPPNNLGNNDPYFLTNFSFLCREGAIGCTAFVDTFNKSDSGPRAYNVQLSGLTGTTVTVSIGGKPVSCQIEQGKTSCYQNVKGSTPAEINAVPGASFVTSTFYIPADTAADTPIYLVAKNDQVDFTCNSIDLGCTMAGVQKSTPSGNQFQSTIIKLDPALLEESVGTAGILCQQQALGCGIYNSSQGEAYFKDPADTGAKICKYNPGVIKDDNKVSGWFWKDVGVCGNTTTLKEATPKTTCVNDGDCTKGGCVNENLQPCYPNYLQNGDNYGLWSYGNKDKYENFVGECTADQNACTEFVDHSDNDRAYYFIKDNKISEGDCSGMASQKAGCVIFDQTDKPNKRWNTAATYLLSDIYVPGKNSDSATTNKVPPVDQGVKNDANILIKVSRDRECAEWLQCRQSKSVWNDQLSGWKQVCETVDRCNRLPADAKEDNPTNCAQFIGGQHSDSNKPLTEEIYFNRDVTWSGHDYAGLSILKMYPVEELKQFDINTVTTSLPDWRLAKPVACNKANNGVNCPTNPLTNFSCVTSNVECGIGGEGMCFNGNCLRDPFGSKEAKTIKEKAPIYTCRAYPNFDSPFPNLIPTTKQGFANVNKCGEYPGDNAPRDQAMKCDCDYTKVSFGNGATIKYFNYKLSKLGDEPVEVGKPVTSKPGDSNSSICVGGSPTIEGKITNGELCAVGDVDTPTPKSCPGGTCQIRDKVTQFLGWKGQCLEYDLSRTVNGQKDEHPCLSWLPVDKLEGTIDINDQNPKAGFIPPDDSAYCLSGVVYKTPASHSACRWDGDSNDPLCGEDDCQKSGEAYCSTIPGYWLKREFKGSKADWATSTYKDSYYSPSGVVGDDGADMNRCGKGTMAGQDCSEPTPDECAIDCVPAPLDNPIQKTLQLEYNKWSDQTIPYYSEVKVGCRAPVIITQKDVAFTDNIWNGKKNFSLSVAPKIEKNLAYNYNSPSKPFARLGQIVDKDLIGLMYCKTTSDILMPNINGSCDDPATEKTEIDGNGTIIKNLSYSTFGLVPLGPACTSDQSCNLGITCNGATPAATNGSYCTRFCRDKSDCNFSYTIGDTAPPYTKTVTVDLGNCEGYVAYDDVTGLAKLGTCSIKAKSDNVCAIDDFTQKCFLQPLSSPTTTFSNPSAGTKKGTCSNIIGSAGVCSDNSSNKCFANKDCYSQFCINSFPPQCIGSVKQAPQLNPILNKIYEAYVGFHQLFAKVNIENFKVFSFEKYVKLIDDDKTIGASELKNDITSNGVAPTIHSVGACDVDDKCIENTDLSKDYTNSITVNNKFDTNVRITAQPHAATIKFFVFADKNQMPIKRIVVDWGDDINTKTYGGVNGEGSFSNQRGATADKDGKLTDICKPEGEATEFGLQLKTTCDNHYFKVESTYNCIGEADIKHWDKDCAGDIKMQQDYGGCCVFKPKVQVLDNWGWCNGTCPGGADGTKGCYNGGVDNQECTKYLSTDPLGSYTSFVYNVLVAPNKTVNP